MRLLLLLVASWLMIGSCPARADEFLATDFEPLSLWLDEAFEVEVKHMTVGLIFDQRPLNDIFYEVEVERKGPAFNYASANVTRRELLEKIAKHFGLDMSVKVDESGMPTAIADQRLNSQVSRIRRVRYGSPQVGDYLAVHRVFPGRESRGFEVQPEAAWGTL